MDKKKGVSSKARTNKSGKGKTGSISQIGNIRVNSAHLNDPTVMKLLAANTQNKIHGIDYLTYIFKTGGNVDEGDSQEGSDDDEWEGSDDGEWENVGEEELEKILDIEN